MRIWSLVLIALILLVPVPGDVPLARADEGGCEPSPTDPNTNVSPPQGTTSTRFFFCARGFGKEEPVKLWVNAPDGGLISDQHDPGNKYAIASNKDGDTAWSWFPPQGWGLPLGTYTMVAHATSSGVERVIHFEIVDTIDPSQSTLRDVQPEMARAGTVFKFWARGFEPDEKLNYLVRPVGGEPPEKDYDDYVGEVSAEGTGQVAWTWKSPTKAADGKYEMVIGGTRSQQSRTIRFSIGQPPIADPKESGVSPAVGSPGAEFAFFARGFSTEERLRLSIVYPDGSQKNDNAEPQPLDTGSPIERVRADWTWTSPRNAQPGAYVMVAVGNESGVTHQIPFEIH